MSETARYRHLTVPFCQGNGLDIACGNDPVTPNAIQVELSKERMKHYRGGEEPNNNIELHGDDFWKALPFKTGVLDFVYSSHYLEDVPHEEWVPTLREWLRVLKSGGHLVILCPERNLWKAALDRGQTMNAAHRYEPYLGDISKSVAVTGVRAEVVQEKLTALDADDYTIMAVFKKL